jgi:FlaG/FlaF family flagellin (archaellin)
MKKQSKFMKAVSYVLGTLIVVAIASGCVAVIVKCFRYLF